MLILTKFHVVIFLFINTKSNPPSIYKKRLTPTSNGVSFKVIKNQNITFFPFRKKKPLLVVIIRTRLNRVYPVG